MGDGRFAEPAEMTLDTYAQPMLITDVDGDGKAEIVGPSYWKNSVAILKPR